MGIGVCGAEKEKPECQRKNKFVGRGNRRWTCWIVDDYEENGYGSRNGTVEEELSSNDGVEVMNGIGLTGTITASSRVQYGAMTGETVGVFTAAVTG